jgi:glycolate oxidase FAD binding subunit
LTKSTDLLPVSETLAPADGDELAATVRACYGDDLAVYPIGGGTSLDFGLPPKKPGVALSLAALGRVVDYPARDMTVTVEAGATMAQLADLLAGERQRLPVDVPQAERATIGGVIATNFNGPRRYGQGTIRDYVIGIRAVDGRGMPYRGGGRVVKNVAGYDFCKLLTGSLGTLGVITEVTLKLKPLPERIAAMVCAPKDEVAAESLLAALVRSRTTPVAIELLDGPQWAGDPALAPVKPAQGARGLFLAVAFEGSQREVAWMADQLGRDWWDQGVDGHHTLFDADAAALVNRLVEFPASGPAVCVLRASILPSQVTNFLRAVRTVDPNSSSQAHAGSGIVIARLAQPPAGGVTKGLIGTLQAAAATAQGTLIVLSGTVGEPTHPSVWGPLSGPQWLMTAVKREFDPRNILNPDRFVYASYEPAGSSPLRA